MRPCAAGHDEALAATQELERWAAERRLELKFLTMRQDLIEHKVCELEGCQDALVMERDRLVQEVEVYNHKHSSCSHCHITRHCTPCRCCHPRLNKDLTPAKC